jgi:hypothetical protein
MIRSFEVAESVVSGHSLGRHPAHNIRGASLARHRSYEYLML